MAHRSILKHIKSNVKHWYIPVILGIFFMIGGFFIFSTPLASFITLTWLFAFLFLVSGISEIIFALVNRNELENFGWLLFGGVIDTILGLILLNSMELSMAILPIYIGIILMFRSFRGMAVSFELKEYGAKNWFGIFILALIGLIFSVMMVANFTFGAFTIVYWTAFTFIFLGVSSLVYGFQLRSLKKHAGRISEDLAKRYEEIQEEINRAIHKE
ncbi:MULTISPECIES: HdeD family acid-resistance protein [Myroides]|uniref:HdeD family acid-resistance protein n=1 Tax=Myroides albus TaxID=2562892 RepID=A0A6I3LDA5_9FLAO|nr:MULTISPECIES: DUF308 domain-containing protein [Myroides]MTG97469.1 HdeD family acid-resistance protein [Myroides albus]MVX34519.1 HdeD family acid-resistance protein [Myroides sp. LoEW2-1]UVD79500.1 DUF308 domain-containing protein [Myroides albus]